MRRAGSPPVRSRRAIGVTVGVASCLALTGCGADGPDAYTVAAADASPTTVRTIPSSTAPSDASAADGSAPDVVEMPPNGEVVQVRSLDNSFRMADIEVVAGTEVWWTNNGRNEHDVLPVDESQEWGVAVEDFAPGDEYRHVFGVPGTYLYYCSIHGTQTVGMVGSVTVLPG